MPREHLCDIHGNKSAGAAGQDFALFVLDFRDVGVLASGDLLLAPGNSKRLAQRNRPEILDGHGLGKRHHAAQLVYLAHGFVEDGGNDAAVRVSGRAGVTLGQLEIADRLAAFLVEVKLEAHAGEVVLAAGEAMILRRFGMRVDGVSMSWFAAGHKETRF